MHSHTVRIGNNVYTRVNKDDLESACMLAILVSEFLQQVEHRTTFSTFFITECNDQFLIFIRVLLQQRSAFQTRHSVMEVKFHVAGNGIDTKTIGSTLNFLCLYIASVCYWGSWHRAISVHQRANLPSHRMSDELGNNGQLG